MRILLTNDDGIHAEGLAVLERIARTLSDDIWVVAPETDQSGLAHSLTISEPLRLRKIDDRHFALRGTPTDCVIMALREVLPEPPDLILSGVNSGQNIADDVTYSGTVAGAMEGALNGIRSIALSQAYNWDQGRVVPWEVCLSHAPGVLQSLLALDLSEDIFLNVNFPNCNPDAVTGTRVTAQGKLTHGIFVEERADGRGFPYYWLRFGRGTQKPAGDSDIQALHDNKISITPLKLDFTAHEVRKLIEEAIK
jgi:5'-nucleotidase